MIEAIVAISILSMIGLGVVLFQQSVLRSTKTLQSSLMAEAQARRVLMNFVTEMRTAKRSPAGAYAIESAATSSIVFYANIDTATDTERVRYFTATATAPFGGMVVKKGVTKPTGTTYNTANERTWNVVFDVKNGTSTALFSYFDSSYTGTTSPLTTPISVPSVRMIRMQVLIDPNAARSPIPKSFMTQVTPRNLKSNL